MSCTPKLIFFLTAMHKDDLRAIYIHMDATDKGGKPLIDEESEDLVSCRKQAEEMCEPEIEAALYTQQPPDGMSRGG